MEIKRYKVNKTIVIKEVIAILIVLCFVSLIGYSMYCAGKVGQMNFSSILCGVTFCGITLSFLMFYAFRNVGKEQKVFYRLKSFYQMDHFDKEISKSNIQEFFSDFFKMTCPCTYAIYGANETILFSIRKDFKQQYQYTFELITFYDKYIEVKKTNLYYEAYYELAETFKNESLVIVEKQMVHFNDDLVLKEKDYSWLSMSLVFSYFVVIVYMVLIVKGIFSELLILELKIAFMIACLLCIIMIFWCTKEVLNSKNKIQFVERKKDLKVFKKIEVDFEKILHLMQLKLNVDLYFVVNNQYYKITNEYEIHRTSQWSRTYRGDKFYYLSKYNENTSFKTYEIKEINFDVFKLKVMKVFENSKVELIDIYGIHE